MLELDNVSQDFPSPAGPRPALTGVSLVVPRGSFLSVIGPSGCGKTSLLRLLAGLDAPAKGAIRHDARRVEGPSPSRAIVFQQYALFPWLTAARNIEFGLKARGLSARERRERTARFIELVGLEGFEDAYPHQLSGGMQQRVAIARALVGEPDVVLMDEPFGALDALTRERMQEEVLLLRERTGATFVLVTHSVDEAVFLGDRVAVLSDRPGRLTAMIEVELGRPRRADMRTEDERFARAKKAVLGALGARRTVDA